METEIIPRRALLVGIDEYEHMEPLKGSVADATTMRDLLVRDEGGSPNYDCQLVTPAPDQKINRGFLRSKLTALFDSFKADILFYFSGHGVPLRGGGGNIVTQEGDRGDPGLPMDELLNLANGSGANSVLLILDCCYAGHLGDPARLQEFGGMQQAQLSEGVTILAASRSSERSYEEQGHGVFTRLIIEALKGGAADVRGLISAASIYGYAEQALNAWDQRPLYKSHAARLAPIRRTLPSVPDSLLRRLPALFESADSFFQMGPSFEFSHPEATSENVEIFNLFKVLRNARLLVTESGKDLYFVALDGGRVQLTPLGQFYWLLAKRGRI